MKTIYKYEIEPAEHGLVSEIELPVGSEILKVAGQGSGVFAWAVVDTKVDRTYTQRLAVIPTGAKINKELYRDLEENFMFLDTAMLLDGAIVLHIFQEVNLT